MYGILSLRLIGESGTTTNHDGLGGLERSGLLLRTGIVDVGRGRNRRVGVWSEVCCVDRTAALPRLWSWQKIMRQDMRTISWLYIYNNRWIHYSFGFIKKVDSIGSSSRLPLLCTFAFLSPVD